MSFRFEIEQWEAACVAFDNKEYEPSLKTFISIADNSKIHFNIGLIFAVANEHERAVASYNKAIQLDSYMAVAYFQRGVSYFIKNEMVHAISDFNQAYEQMRGNSIINYNQLGLQFRLYACEVLFNRGICQLRQGKMDAGLTDLYYAQKAGTTGEHAIIDQAVRDRGKGYSVFSIPPTVLFRPPENKLRQLKGGMFAAAVDQISPKKTYKNSVLLDYRLFRSDSGIYSESSNSNRNTASADSGYEYSLKDRFSSSSSSKLATSRQRYSKEEDEGYGDFDKELEEVYGSFNTLAIDASSSTDGKLKIKVHYNDTRILLVSNTITFEQLTAKIQEKFSSPASILLKYKDEEDELVLLIDDDDLQIARHASRRTNSQNGLEKLELWCVDT
ncbi:unnamed protein product [Rhizopus stolonifer]